MKFCITPSAFQVERAVFANGELARVQLHDVALTGRTGNRLSI